MLKQIEQHFWRSQVPVQDAIARQMKDVLAKAKLVVDVGAGSAPWSRATDLVDRYSPSAAGPRRVHILDVNSQPLPFADKEVDFIYTRHTLEDIYNPLYLCREMNRVARAGYIETPSAACEFCRGVDVGKPAHRGYVHHRYFIWSEKDMLYFLPKFPVVEHMNLGAEMENRLTDILNQMPIVWNTYLLWNGSFPFQMFQDDSDLGGQGYIDLIIRGVNSSIQSATRFAEENNIVDAAFRPS